MGSYRWIDMNVKGGELGLLREYSVVHNGYQFAETTARNGVSSFTSAAFPYSYVQRFTTGSGIFQLCSENSNDDWVIYRSPDGVASYTEVLRGTTTYASGYVSAIIDCGNDRIMYAEYGGEDTGSRLYYSKDGGVNWGNNPPDYNDGDELLTSYPGSIRHFHGGHYDSEYDRFYLFSGDSDIKNSIMWCDDVEHLAANPATWSARWGLDDASRSTLDLDWIVGYNDYVWRVISVALHGDYMYFGADALNVAGQPVGRVHRNTHVFEPLTIKSFSTKYDHSNALGEVWCWGVTASGIVLMCGSASLASSVGGDGLMHIYALDPGGLSMTEIYQVNRTTPTELSIPHRMDILGDYVIISNRLRMPTVMGMVVADPFGNTNSSDMRSRMSQQTLNPKIFDPWNTSMKTGIAQPAYVDSEVFAYKHGPSQQAKSGAASNPLTWADCSVGIPNETGAHFFAGNRWNVTPGVRSITKLATRFGYMVQDTNITDTFIEVWKKTATHMVRVAASGSITSVGGSGSVAAQTWTPSTPVNVTIEEGGEYYVGLRMVRTDATTTTPWVGMSIASNFVDTNIRICMSVDHDWQTSSSTLLSYVTNQSRVTSSGHALQLEVEYTSDQCLEMNVDSPTEGAYLVPVATILPYCMKLSSADVADTESLAIAQNDTYSTGEAITRNTTKLDCGEASAGVDTLLDGGNTLTLGTIGATRQAAQPFDFIFGINKTAGKANLFYQCLGLEDNLHCHAVKNGSIRGLDYTYTGGRILNLTGTFTCGSLQVGIRPLIYVGDAQAIATDNTPDTDLLGNVHAELSKPRMAIVHGSSSKTLATMVTDIFSNSTPGDGDGIELVGFDGVWLFCGMGVFDAIAATTTTISDAREAISQCVQSLTDFAEQVFALGDELVLVGLPPYSDNDATPSEVEYAAKAVRWFNRALLGLSLAWRVPFYNPWPDMVQASTVSATTPTFLAAYTSDGGLTYSATGGAIVRTNVVAAYETASIDLRDAW